MFFLLTSVNITFLAVALDAFMNARYLTGGIAAILGVLFTGLTVWFYKVRNSMNIAGRKLLFGRKKKRKRKKSRWECCDCGECDCGHCGDGDCSFD